VSYPTTPRVVAGVGAIATALYLGVLEPLAFARLGCAASGAVLAACALVLAAFLAALALAPDALQRLLARLRSPIDLHDGGHVAATVVMAGTVFFVVGWGALLTATATVESAYGSCALGGADVPTSGDAILRDVTINLALFTLPVLFFVAFVHGRGPVGAFRLLGLKAEGAPRALAWGVALAVGVMVLLVVLEQGLSYVLPSSALDNPTALDIAKSVTLPGAFALAAASALGEEIFFRGFLQPRIGLVATALVFSLAHFSYASAGEVIAVLILAFAMGLLYKRTGNLWATIATHFTFNLVNLVLGSYAVPGT
jgi:membrane protease YdiL (CAAX protease family)